MQRLGRHLEVRVNIVNEVAVALGAATADDIMWQRIAHVYVLQVVVVPGKVRLHACHLRARASTGLMLERAVWQDYCWPARKPSTSLSPGRSDTQHAEMTVPDKPQQHIAVILMPWYCSLFTTDSDDVGSQALTLRLLLLAGRRMGSHHSAGSMQNQPAEAAKGAQARRRCMHTLQGPRSRAARASAWQGGQLKTTL